MRDWHLLAETAHFTHIEGVVTRVAHRTGAKEQTRFEERVSEEMEYASSPCANTQSHDHVPELRNR